MNTRKGKYERNSMKREFWFVVGSRFPYGPEKPKEERPVKDRIWKLG